VGEQLNLDLVFVACLAAGLYIDYAEFVGAELPSSILVKNIPLGDRLLQDLHGHHSHVADCRLRRDLEVEPK
jgi:hypothetical protein